MSVQTGVQRVGVMTCVRVGGSLVVVVVLLDAEDEIVRNLPIGEEDPEGMEEEAVRALARAEGSRALNSKPSSGGGI